MRVRYRTTVSGRGTKIKQKPEKKIRRGRRRLVLLLCRSRVGFLALFLGPTVREPRVDYGPINAYDFRNETRYPR